MTYKEDFEKKGGQVGLENTLYDNWRATHGEGNEGVDDYIVREGPSLLESGYKSLVDYLTPKDTAYSNTVLDEYWLEGMSAGRQSGSHVDPVDIEAILNMFKGSGESSSYVPPGMLGKQKVF